MAIIPLRVYNHEIEGMIDNGQLDEAVAHCRHILATFPKHIATYRLLGKAHLEQQRISDATDIFQRVLTSIPDDFIANVGMSIIREDENNVDSAIWHMERAYEAQPANLAIQDELRRLYGRRDGMQPPKVRLTRGALARMYAKGGLYDQAVGELRAAITEDPNRPDLQLLLAEMFFQAGQRVEAVETSANILKKIPFCLEANRILAISLPETDGSETVKNYRQTAISMDPYYAFAGPEAITTDQVPENAVNIERLDYKSGIQVNEAPIQPTWASSLGISIEKPSDENIPEWLKSAEAPATSQANADVSPSVSPFIWDSQEVAKVIKDTSKPDPEIPDWMKEAGWQPASDEPAKPAEQVAPVEPIAEAPQSENIEKAELPDWLRGIAPENVLNEPKPAEESGENTLSTPWLEQHQPGPSDSIIHWLEDNKPEKPKSRPAKEQEASQLAEDEVPDWLKDLEPAQPSAPATAETPGPTSAFTIEPSAFIDQMQPSEAPAAEVSSFENNVRPELPPSEPSQPLEPENELLNGAAKAVRPGEEEEIPDWLKQLAEELPPIEAGQLPAEEIQPTETVQPPSPDTAEGSVAPETQETGTAAAFIGTSTAETLPAAEEPPQAELLVEPAETAEQIPAEVVDQQETSGGEMIPPKEEQPEARVPAAAEPPAAAEVAAEGQGLDEFAWLKELAAEKGTGEAMPATGEGGELIPPDWEKLEAELPSEESIGLMSSAAEAKAVPSEEVPDWIKGLGEEPVAETPAEPPASAAPELEISPNEELPAWLRELEEPEPEKAEGVTPTEELEWKPDELPTWLKEITESEQPAEEPAPVVTPAAEEALPTEAAVASVEPPPVEEVRRAAETAPEEVPAAAEAPALAEVTAEAEEVPAAAEAPALAEVTAEAVEAPVLAEGPVEAAVIGPAEEPLAVKEAPVTSGEALPMEEPAAVIEEPVVSPAAASTEALPVVQPPEAVPAQAGISEPALEWSSEATPPAGIKKEALEVPPAAAELPVAPVAEAAQPAPAVAEGASPPAQAEAQANQTTLDDARSAVNAGDASQALQLYNKLIKQNYHLDEIVNDMQEALYRFPVDPELWVSLGDAHFRLNDLPAALSAYTKAEELVR